MRSQVALLLELQLDQPVEKAETPRSSEGRVAGSLGILLFLLQLQDCECEKQAGMTSVGLFWLFFLIVGGFAEHQDC